MIHILTIQIKHFTHLASYANQVETLHSEYEVLYQRSQATASDQTCRAGGGHEPVHHMAEPHLLPVPRSAQLHRQPKCGANTKSDLERTLIAAVKGELWSGARLEQGLSGVEGVHGDGGGAYRRRSGGRVAGEHAVAQRLAASNHCGGQEWNTHPLQNGRAANQRFVGEGREKSQVTGTGSGAQDPVNPIYNGPAHV
jgi:hypothetical protein